MQRIRPGFQVLVPAAIFVWAWMALTMLFGPDRWYSAAQLRYVNQIPDAVWGVACGIVAVGIALGALGGSWTILRLSLGLALFLALTRCILLGLTLTTDFADNVATIPVWAYLAVTHVAVAREPFTTTA